MTLLIAGLLLFLGVHSVRILADGFRTRQLARLGENAWKGLYSLASIAGFALIVWGYGLARQQPLVLWQRRPAAPRGHAAELVAFVLVAAAAVPGNGVAAAKAPDDLGVRPGPGAPVANNTATDLLLRQLPGLGGVQLSRRKGTRSGGGTNLPVQTLSRTLLTPASAPPPGLRSRSGLTRPGSASALAGPAIRVRRAKTVRAEVDRLNYRRSPRALRYLRRTEGGCPCE
jgi:hypothetical protein